MSFQTPTIKTYIILPKPNLKKAKVGFGKKLANIILLSTLLLSSAHTTSADAVYGWAKSFGGTDNEESLAIATDSNGNVYTAGYFNGTVDFDPGAGTSNIASAGFSDAFISKLDSSGNFVWAKRIGNDTNSERARGIAVDSSGNVYTTGLFVNTVDFDPGAGTSNLTATGVDAFISKLDSSGNFVWAKRLGGGGLTNSRGIALDSTGSNVYTMGDFNDTADFNPGVGTANLTAAGVDGFISKLDSSGNFVWVKQLTGADGDAELTGSGIALDSNNNVHTIGQLSGTVDFDPGAGTANLTAEDVNHIFISKLDSSGNFVWAKQIAPPTEDDEVVGNAVAVDGSSNIHITGYLYGTADFDPGVGTTNLVSDNGGIYTLKLDSSGNLVWVKQFGGDVNEAGKGIAVDSSSNVYTTGLFSETADFDPGAGTSNLSLVGSSDVFISKLDSSGNFVWAAQMGGTSADSATAITIDSSSNVYTTGTFRETSDFDPGAGTANLVSAGTDDIFVQKLLGISAPTVTESAASSITTTTATLNGNITDTGGESNTARGFHYGLTDSYGSTVSESGSYDTGAFTANITGLACNTTYYYRAFSTNSVATTNSSGTSFATSACPGGGLPPQAFSPITPPASGNFAVSINSGATSTTSSSVNLTFTLGPDTQSMAISNDPGFTSAVIEPLVETKTWTLSPGAGTKTVYAKFYNSYGQSSDPATDSIELVTSGQEIITPLPTPGGSTNSPPTISLRPGSLAQEGALLNTNLSVGTTSPTVQTLQQFLNSQGFTLAPNGPGSPGQETDYFGPRTRRSLIRFQEYYKGEILTPLGLTKGTGFFGPKTRAWIKELTTIK